MRQLTLSRAPSEYSVSYTDLQFGIIRGILMPVLEIGRVVNDGWLQRFTRLFEGHLGLDKV